MASINAKNGVTVKDIQAEEFIKAFGAYLKKSGKFKIPEWSVYAKTACFHELAPYDPDWLYIRAASVARQVYLRRKVGISSLRDHYGGKMRMGVQSSRHRRAAGKVIRYSLKQLSDMGLVGILTVEGEGESGSTTSSIGRKLTKKGMTDMDRIASQVAKEKKKAQ